jgi:hypothetical protein
MLTTNPEGRDEPVRSVWFVSFEEEGFVGKKYLRLKSKFGLTEVAKKQIRRKVGKYWRELSMPPTLCLVGARYEIIRAPSEPQAHSA